MVVSAHSIQNSGSNSSEQAVQAFFALDQSGFCTL